MTKDAYVRVGELVGAARRVLPDKRDSKQLAGARHALVVRHGGDEVGVAVHPVVHTVHAGEQVRQQGRNPLAPEVQHLHVLVGRVHLQVAHKCAHIQFELIGHP